MKRLLPYLLLFCFVSSFSVHAFEVEGLPITLEAMHVEYDNASRDIFATGNVVVDHVPYMLYADQFQYTHSLRELKMIGNVRIVEGDHEILARTFVYYFSTQRGHAYDVKSMINGTHISGDALQINPTRSVLETVHFTTCDLDNPHYSVRSDRAYLYPKTGDLVAKDNVINLYGAPIFVFPNYVYNAKTWTQQQQQSSIPEIGSNRIDGTYIKVNNGYFHSPESNGVVTMGATGSRGFMGGVQHRFTLGNDQRLYLKGYYVQDTGLEGGGIFEWDVMSSQNSHKMGFFEALYRPFSSQSDSFPYSKLTLYALRNEMLNYHLVDLKPMLELQIGNIPVSHGVTFASILDWGHFRDDSADTTRFHADMSLGRHWDFKHQTFAGIEGHYIDQLYGNAQDWNRWYGKLYWGFKKLTFSATLSYIRLFRNVGSSPFSFDSDNQIASDELGLKMEASIFDHPLSLDLSYNLEDNTFRDAWFSTGLRQHCWTLMLSWNAVWNEYRLGASLVH